MKILDNYSHEIVHLYRPLACSSCCFPCCLQTMEVSAPPGNPIGTVEQEWTICCPSFAVKNHTGDTVLRIEGPLCTFSMCGDVEFKVYTSVSLFLHFFYLLVIKLLILIVKINKKKINSRLLQ